MQTRTPASAAAAIAALAALGWTPEALASFRLCEAIRKQAIDDEDDRTTGELVADRLEEVEWCAEVGFGFLREAEALADTIDAELGLAFSEGDQ